MSCFLTDDADRTVVEINQQGGQAIRDQQCGAWLHPRPKHGLFTQLSQRYLERG